MGADRQTDVYVGRHGEGIGGHRGPVGSVRGIISHETVAGPGYFHPVRRGQSGHPSRGRTGSSVGAPDEFGADRGRQIHQRHG